MVGEAELVFNDNNAPILVTRKNIDPEVANGNLGSLNLQRPQVQRVCEQRQIFRVGKPGGKVAVLAEPDLRKGTETRRPRAGIVIR